MEDSSEGDELPSDRAECTLYEENINLNFIAFKSDHGEHGNIRCQHKVDFVKLPALAIANKDDCTTSSIRDKNQLQLQPRLRHTSRYKDFNNMQHIATGGFGSVYKATHKLDQVEYAIKKIHFYDNIMFKILREVRNLVQMSHHKHIIRYYTSWLEQSDQSTISPVRSTQESNYSQTIISNSSSHGIVFEPGASTISRNSCHSNTNCLEIVDEFIKVSYTYTLHIQMELCTQTLGKWLLERNGLSSLSSGESVYKLINKENSRKILKQVLKGIRYMHSRDVIHRDLKPDNIFLARDDNGKITVKIGDFGLSRSTVDNAWHDMDADNHAVTAAVVGVDCCYTRGVGTPSYAAPEQLNSSCYTTKSDMYSLGVIIYELYEPFLTVMEKCKALQVLRNKQYLSTEFCEAWREQAMCIKALVGKPSVRPSAEELLHEDFLCSHNKATLRMMLASKDEELRLQQDKIVQLEELLSERKQ